MNGHLWHLVTETEPVTDCDVFTNVTPVLCRQLSRKADTLYTVTETASCMEVSTRLTDNSRFLSAVFLRLVAKEVLFCAEREGAVRKVADKPRDDLPEIVTALKTQQRAQLILSHSFIIIYYWLKNLLFLLNNRTMCLLIQVICDTLQADSSEARHNQYYWIKIWQLVKENTSRQWQVWEG